MRNKKKQVTEKVAFNISPVFMTRLSVGDHRDFESLLHLMKASCCSEQVSLLEKLQVSLCRRDQLLEDDLFGLQILCEFYFQVPLKNILRKRFHSFFVVLNEKYQGVVTECLSNVLKAVLDKSLSAELSEGCHSGIDIISGLLESFSSGKEALLNNCLLVCTYLCCSVENLSSCLKEEQAVQSKNLFYSQFQCAFKGFAFILHNNTTSKLTSGVQNCDSYLKKPILKRVLHVAVSLLKDVNTPCNCRMNSALLWCSILNLTEDFSFLGYLLNQDDAGNLVRPKWDVFPPVSKVCICSGIIAVVLGGDFVLVESGNCLANIILSEVVAISKSSKESDVLLLSGRTLLQWTVYMQKMIMNGTVDSNFFKDGEAVKILVQYVLTNSEHYIDCLQHFSRDIFENTIMLCQLSIEVESELSYFLNHLVETFLDMPWSCRVKYNALGCLAKKLGVTKVHKLRPSLPQDLCQALGDATSACHVADLYETLFVRCISEISSSELETIWIEPLIHTLCQDTKQRGIAIIEHIFPKLFATYPDSVYFLMDKLSTLSTSSSEDCLTALMVCVKFAQNNGLKIADGYENILEGILERALCHRDYKVRLSAFSLICDPHKTTKMVSEKEINLIKESVPWNVCCQCPAFRQQFIAYLKKFLQRVKENLIAHTRKNCDNPDSIQMCKHFLEWLLHYSISCLHPGANFPRRVTSLNLLVILFEIFGDFVHFKLFSIFIKFAYYTQTLMEALRDTYENNKQAALTVLSSLSSDIEDHIPIVESFNVALHLARSTKPPESVTAAYIFKLLMKFDRTNATTVCYLEKHNVDKGSNSSLDSTVSQELVAFNVIRVLIVALNEQLIVAEEDILKAAAQGPLYGVLFCIRTVLNEVDFKCINDRPSILQWRSLFVQLIELCFRVSQVVMVIVCNASPEGHLPMDTDEETLDLMQQAVGNSIGRQNISSTLKTTGSDAASIPKMHAVTAQMLLLCSWRTHKEISLLFGEVAERVPCTTDQDESIGVLPSSLLLEMGQYFTIQLSQVKHRGAFEQAYVGFRKLCHTIRRCTVEDLQKLPPRWLNDLIAVISGRAESVNLCSSRRSAGIPFMVQAILVSEPEIHSYAIFRDTMDSLLKMAFLSNTSSFTTDSQIHSLNILRTLFRDSYLGECVMSFVAEGLKASILAFKSQSWAVRNSSTLLFSALVTRIFGVNRSREEIQKKNCLSGLVFFTRFPSLFGFLSEELKAIVCELNTSDKCKSISVDSSLCPILHILGRLYPSPMEKRKVSLQLSDFVPLIFSCAGSVMWKTRVLAAKALFPLLSSDELPIILNNLFSLMSSAFEQKYNNKVHGLLLQILQILKELHHYLHLSIVDKIKTLLPNWIASSMFLTKSNSCYITRGAFMEILCYCLSLSVAIDERAVEEIVGNVLEECHNPVHSSGREHFLVPAVTFVLFYTHVASTGQLSPNAISLTSCSSQQNIGDEIFSLFLTSPIPEVQLCSLDFFLWLLGDSNTSCTSEFVFLGDFCCSKVHLEINGSKRLKEGTLRSAASVLTDIALKEELQITCLSKVYRLMCLMPEYTTRKWTGFSSSSEILEWILGRLPNHSRDDIKISISLFSIHVANRLFQDMQQLAVVTDEVDILSKEIAVLPLLAEWAKEIEKNAGPENTIECREMVLFALDRVKGSLLVDRHRILGSDVWILWKALLLLLTDDEPDIKNEAVIIVSYLTNQLLEGPESAASLPVVPTLALRDFLELFKHQYSASYPSEFVSIMLGWMLQCSSDDCDDDFQTDEQPFDKGEMNIFCEQLHLTSLVSQTLRYFLQDYTKLKDLKIFSKYIRPQRLVQQDVQTVEDFVVICVRVLCRWLEEFDYSPFLNKQFDAELLRISQMVDVVTCLWPCVQFSDTSCINNLKVVFRKLELMSANNLFLCDSVSRIGAVFS